MAGRQGLPWRRGAAALSLRDRLLGWRDKMLSSPNFQRFAVRFPLTRPVARRRAKTLFDLCAGFVYSQILLACVRLRLLDWLADRPLSAAELAPTLGLSEEATTLLLDAAAALDLVQRRSGGRYGLGQLGAELIGNPGVAAMIEHHSMFYGDLRDPVALLRGQGGTRQLADYWAYAKGGTPSDLSGAAVAPYTALMAALQPMVAREVLSAYSFAPHRCLLDVGGGDGSFLAAVAATAPALQGLLFDLPAVAAQAGARFAACGLASRISVIGGSFLAEPLPDGADVVSLVRVIHDHDDDVVMALLRAVARALPDRGTLLIAEPITGLPGTETIGDAYFAFYLLAMGSGRPRSFARLKQMLQEAGFAEVRLHSGPMPMVASVITAVKTSPSMLI